MTADLHTFWRFHSFSIWCCPAWNVGTYTLVYRHHIPEDWNLQSAYKRVMNKPNSTAQNSWKPFTFFVSSWMNVPVLGMWSAQLHCILKFKDIPKYTQYFTKFIKKFHFAFRLMWKNMFWNVIICSAVKNVTLAAPPEFRSKQDYFSGQIKY